MAMTREFTITRGVVLSMEDERKAKQLQEKLGMKFSPLLRLALRQMYENNFKESQTTSRDAYPKVFSSHPFSIS